jgi:cysteine desulfurase
LCEGIPGLALNGHPRQRLPNTLNVRFPGVSGNSLLRACPEVAASTGSACHSDRESASPVILAMGVPGNEAIGSVRLSLGRATTDADILRASTALLQGWRSLQSANS